MTSELQPIADPGTVTGHDQIWVGCAACVKTMLLLRGQKNSSRLFVGVEDKRTLRATRCVRP
jgi:hypothetical protein